MTRVMYSPWKITFILVPLTFLTMFYPSNSYCAKEITQKRVVVSTKIKGTSKTKRLALMTFCVQILEMQKQKNKLKIKGKVQYFLFTLIITNSGFIFKHLQSKKCKQKQTRIRNSLDQAHKDNQVNFSLIMFY